MSILNNNRVMFLFRIGYFIPTEDKTMLISKEIEVKNWLGKKSKKIIYVPDTNVKIKNRALFAHPETLKKMMEYVNDNYKV